MSQDPKTTINPSPPPPGFEQFWRESLAELLQSGPTLDFEDEETTSGKVRVARLSSFGGVEVRVMVAAASTKKAKKARPLLVTAHGYGGQMEPERVRRLSQFGFDVVGLDVRGFGRSTDAVPKISPYGYLLTGSESKETSILRGAVLDFIQAYRAGLGYFGEPRGVTFQGFSFAGGLSVMATAVLSLSQGMAGAPPLPRILASGVPTFGYLEKRLELCQAGSGRELYRFLQQRFEEAEVTKAIFEYFDTCHFAPYLRRTGAGLGRMIFGVGAYDPVVPPETVYAIINAMPEPPEIHLMPCSHTERPEEAEWVRWESAWIRASQAKSAAHSASL